VIINSNFTSHKTKSPFVSYYGYCKSLDGTTIFAKTDANK